MKVSALLLVTLLFLAQSQASLLTFGNQISSMLYGACLATQNDISDTGT